MLALVVGLSARPTHADDADQPNVLFIVADDLGWMDLAVQGSTYYDTPNLDRLAAQGLRFTDAYSASPLCSPTRAALMTGQYPGRIGLTAAAGHLGHVRFKAAPSPNAAPQYRATAVASATRLSNDYRTVAEEFQDAGYRTAFVGKWHLGSDEYVPENQGFEVNIAGGPYPGPPSFFSPYRIHNLPDGPVGEHICDRLTSEVMDLITGYAENDEPFFLAYWTYDVHAPYQGKEDLQEKYRRKADPNNPQRNPIMGAMIEILDQNMGKLLDHLDRLGIADNTIVVFTSDNGGNMYDRPNDLPPTNNAPLRAGKGNIYEGGVRVPTIVRWPGVAPAGQTTDAVTVSPDWVPTLLEAAGIEPTIIGKSQTLDGVSILPVIRGEADDFDRGPIVMDFPHNVPATHQLACVAIRDGDWKLIRYFYDMPDQSEHRYELYNLADDIGETTNLADARPDLVAQLAQALDYYVADTGAVEPIANPQFGKPAPPAPPRAPSARVDGWEARGTASLARGDGIAIITSRGGDPFIVAENVPTVRGELELHVTWRSDSGGSAQVFWSYDNPVRFAAQRSVEIKATHDNEWSNSVIKFKADRPITAVRFDPSRGEGRIEIDSIQLKQADGKQIKQWLFGGKRQ
ncbi:MAG: sulfatase [Planctomycetota bacterium]